jgi:hypothetical protein
VESLDIINQTILIALEEQSFGFIQEAVNWICIS